MRRQAAGRFGIGLLDGDQRLIPNPDTAARGRPVRCGFGVWSGTHAPPGSRQQHDLAAGAPPHGLPVADWAVPSALTPVRAAPAKSMMVLIRSDTVAVGHGDDAVVGQPGMVGLARQACGGGGSVQEVTTPSELISVTLRFTFPCEQGIEHDIQDLVEGAVFSFPNAGLSEFRDRTVLPKE
ncbi:hypothetical protein GCM10009609_65660 [Pseudonocardia aurantiaca]